MESLLPTYASSIYATGSLAGLMLIQVLIADVVAIRSRHVPGTSIPNTHDSVLFRVSRTVANINESVAIYVCALLFCCLTAASPDYTAYCAWTYVAARTVYALFYYLNLPTLRSISFAVSMLSLLAMVFVGILT